MLVLNIWRQKQQKNFQSAVGGTLRNVGGGIMDMFRGDDNFQVGQNTKKAHGGRVHKFSGGIMSSAGMAFPQFINQIANPVQNQITNPVQTNIVPSPNVMLPYTPFMTPGCSTILFTKLWSRCGYTSYHSCCYADINRNNSI